MQKMTEADWHSISKYFKREEFDSPDLPGSGDNMSFTFMKWVYNARSILGFPFIIKSGFRTKKHHAEVYKLPIDSKDLPETDHNVDDIGLGVDLRITDSHKRNMLLEYMFENGIKRKGIYDKHIHIGFSTTLPQNVTWVGKSK